MATVESEDYKDVVVLEAKKCCIYALFNELSRASHHNTCPKRSEVDIHDYIASFPEDEETNSLFIFSPACKLGQAGSLSRGLD